MRYISIALILMLGLAVGCMTTEGKKIDSSKTKSILAEGTTPADVVKMFGEPQQRENLASGETKYVYYYREYRPRLFFKSAAQSQDQQRLEVFIKGNQVERYHYVGSEIEPITTDVPPIVPEKK